MKYVCMLIFLTGGASEKYKTCRGPHSDLILSIFVNSTYLHILLIFKAIFICLCVSVERNCCPTRLRCRRFKEFLARPAKLANVCLTKVWFGLNWLWSTHRDSMSRLKYIGPLPVTVFWVHLLNICSCNFINPKLRISYKIMGQMLFHQNTNHAPPPPRSS